MFFLGVYNYIKHTKQFSLRRIPSKKKKISTTSQLCRQLSSTILHSTYMNSLSLSKTVQITNNNIT